MVINSKKAKRLAVYFFYDKEGIIDEYIFYQLKKLNDFVEEVLFVSNGKIEHNSKKRLNSLYKILERKNIGFDVWAYKEGMEYYGWETLGCYDELILMNYTMYGPLYPFNEMFDEMSKQDLDFWGITKHHGFPFDPFGTIPYGYIPEHIQSSFICVRNSMLKTDMFHQYWENMEQVNSYGEAVGKHEAIFTKKFKEAGFKSEVYIRTDDLKNFTHYPLMIEPLELIKNRRCPVFKRKSFYNEYYEFLNCCVGEPTIEVYEYIRDELDYDLDMVWDNLLRTENMADIKDRMHLNRILSKEKCYTREGSLLKIALMMHVYNEDLIDYCCEYAKNAPKYADVFVTTDTDCKRQKIYKKFGDIECNKLTVLLITNRGRDISALLVGLKPYIANYDLICFAHDKKTTQVEPYTIGKSFSYKCFENILGSPEYVENIISMFKEEKRLGIIMPPPPNHAAFYGIIGTEWGNNFDNTQKIAKKIGLKANLDHFKEPISPLGTMFWFRPEALTPILKIDWKYEDFPEEPIGYDGTALHAIERLYGAAAQAVGFYSAWCMNDKFAAIELTNYHFMLRELTMSIYNTIGFRMGFNQANYDLKNNLNYRRVIKSKIKKCIPAGLWRFMSKIYRILGGKKWTG